MAGACCRGIVWLSRLDFSSERLVVSIVVVGRRERKLASEIGQLESCVLLTPSLLLSSFRRIFPLLSYLNTVGGCSYLPAR